MFGKKKAKKAEPQLSLEERLAATEQRMRAQLLKVQKAKNEALASFLEARRHGMTAQEWRASALLKRQLAAERQINGMLLSMRLTVQERDLATLTRSFIECMGDVSRELTGAVAKTDAKKAEKDYLRAMYAARRQEENLDNMLAVGDYAAMETGESAAYSEFDSEIDALVQTAETHTGGTRDTV